MTARLKRPSLTRNQAEVMGCLNAARRPLTAYEILAGVKGRGITAPTTVYRALERLIEIGRVHRVESANAFAPCSRGVRDHEAAFIRCGECGETIESDLASSLEGLKRRARKAGFEVDHVMVELVGRCTACRGKEGRGARA
jgi:Fur family zinc uptake transcriptional regulator